MGQIHEPPKGTGSLSPSEATHKPESFPFSRGVPARARVAARARPLWLPRRADISGKGKLTGRSQPEEKVKAISGVVGVANGRAR